MTTDVTLIHYQAEISGANSKAGEDRAMMAGVFATLLLAFVLDLSGSRRVAVACLGLSLILGVWLFLWEIYSPDYGFHMPWLQVDAGPLLQRGG
jgi:hypothetical protein